MDERALTDNDLRTLTALQRLAVLHAEMDRRPPSECGWAEFDGISVGGSPIQAYRLMAYGLLERRRHPLYPSQFQYRLTEAGQQRATVCQDDPRYNPYA